MQKIILTAALTSAVVLTAQRIKGRQDRRRAWKQERVTLPSGRILNQRQFDNLNSQARRMARGGA